MKIEKVNENQIRCTLTREDLADRQLKLSELAYGTEKAKILFRDMMQQANYEFGFEANDIPLMVEAIPLSADTIILVITKIDYPEELDTRFSKFSEADEDAYYEDDNSFGSISPSGQGADDILGLFRKVRQEYDSKEEPVKAGRMPAAKTEHKAVSRDPVQVDVLKGLTKMFEFDKLDQVERLASVLAAYYGGSNDLYRHEGRECFYLLVRKDRHTPEEFNKVCNIISEYARQREYTGSFEAHLKEHEKKILEGNALQVLAQLAK